MSYVIRSDFGQTEISDYFLSFIPFLLLASIIVKLIVFSLFKLYHSLWKYASVYEFLAVVMASAVSNGLLLFYILFINYIAPRSIFVITAMLDVFYIGGSRIILQL